MSNNLVGETSPYLLQHVNNPVEWYPWGEQALTLARAQNKPILLSIGYSACHWCHVMAHESFEDFDVAEAMNKHFVNIKVDREERPDIDQIYQTVHHILNQRNGGWPLTMFLTPEQKPFFGGTYFPKVSRHGLPGFLELLPRIAAIYDTRRAAIQKHGISLLGLLADTLPSENLQDTEFSEQLFKKALCELEEIFDAEQGGFGDAPKFIHPAELGFCLQRYFIIKDSIALKLAAFTLDRMAKGGVYDQLGGGFCRYSTDSRWCIPHFEKMLYDNGPLLQLYSDAWLANENPLFEKVVVETANWVIREMQAPESDGGGYYSTLDADSEQAEGKFYIWDNAQVSQVLSTDEYAVVAPYYGLTREPNFEQNYWNLEVTQSLAEIAQAIGIDPEQAQQRLANARSKLFSVRELRIHPGRDEKILVSWNSLMIKGMARSGRIFKNTVWIYSAMLATDFIRTKLWKNNRLIAIYKDGKAHLNAYLDDYAFLLDGLLELMQTEFRQVDLDFAIALAEVLLDQFEDKQAGGFYFTSHDHEQLIHRPKPVHDNATPSGNGIAAIVLQRFGHLLGEYRYIQATQRTLNLFYPMISNHPSVYCSLMVALEEAISPPQIVLLRGERSDLSEWQSVLQRKLPHTLVFALSKELIDLPVSLNKPLPINKTTGAVSAWVCQGTRCFPEISNLQELLHVCEVQGKIDIL